MMCPHCEATVKGALEALDFIKEASADHKAGTVTVELNGNLDIAALKAAVEEKGYTFGGVQNES